MAGHIVDSDASMCVPIVALRDGAKALLASCVPDLYLDQFVVNCK